MGRMCSCKFITPTPPKYALLQRSGRKRQEVMEGAMGGGEPAGETEESREP